jgi:hypothetical protein
VVRELCNGIVQISQDKSFRQGCSSGVCWLTK